MSIEKRFMHYLMSLPLTEQFYFHEDNQGVSFHWSSWDTFCEILSKHQIFESKRQELKKEIFEKIEPLKEETIWINTLEKTTKSTMYDLYSLYLDSRVRDDFFHSDRQILFSESNSSGPFHSLSSLKWKNKDIYRLFMLDKIINGSCPLRRFRLNLDMDVSINFDKFPLRNSVAQIEQMTDHGLVIRMAGSKDFFCLSNSNRIKLIFKVEELNSLYFNQINVPKDCEEIEVTFTPEVLERYGNKKNFTHSREDQIFLFIGFKDLRTSPSTEVLVPYLLDILSDSKEKMEELLEEYLPTLHSGIKRVS